MEFTKYKECYVAFLDILGFKNLVNQNPCGEITEIFKTFFNKTPLRAAYIGDKNIISESTTDELKIKVMSDSICLYIDVNIPNAFLCMLAACITLQYKLLGRSEPIFLRGAIVRGDLYAEDDITFGPALTNAYLMEEKSAKYPRIIMTNEIIQTAKDGNANVLKACVYRDEDAFYAVNYFMALDSDKATYEKVKNVIMHILDTAIDSSIREKYLYLEKKLKNDSGI